MTCGNFVSREADKGEATECDFFGKCCDSVCMLRHVLRDPSCEGMANPHTEHQHS